MDITRPIQPTMIRRWTNSAKDCLSRGCVCEGCFYKNFYKGTRHSCHMKSYVVALVKKFGHPKDVKVKTILEEKV